MDSQKKILLIDSDQQFGKTIKKALDHKKYKVLYSNSCVSGIQKVLEFKPDLILYNTDLQPINASDVFNALNATSFLNQSSIVYISEMDNEGNLNRVLPAGNNIFIKSENINQLIDSIPVLLKNNMSDNADSFCDFRQLFLLSPNAAFVFNEEKVLLGNNAFIDVIKGNSLETLNINLPELFEKASLLKIKHWIKHCNTKHGTFNDQVALKRRIGNEIIINLSAFHLNKAISQSQFIGFLQTSLVSDPLFNYQLANEVCNLLRRENLVVTNNLEKKISQMIKLRTIDNEHQNKTFFTRREYEVLRLSMDGLSIKVIADKLSVSSRTVEKYRTKLMEKSGAKNIVEVIVFSLKNNLITI